MEGLGLNGESTKKSKNQGLSTDFDLKSVVNTRYVFSMSAENYHRVMVPNRPKRQTGRFECGDRLPFRAETTFRERPKPRHVAVGRSRCLSGRRGRGDRDTQHAHLALGSGRFARRDSRGSRWGSHGVLPLGDALAGILSDRAMRYLVRS